LTVAIKPKGQAFAFLFFSYSHDITERFCDMDYSLLLLCSSRSQCPLLGAPVLVIILSLKHLGVGREKRNSQGGKEKMVEAEASAVCKEDLCPLG
jgi:hypothetical protein